MKVIGVVKVYNCDLIEIKDSKTGEIKNLAQCQGMSDDGALISFYRPADEAPVKDDVYQMVLKYSKFKPYVTYQKEQ